MRNFFRFVGFCFFIALLILAGLKCVAQPLPNGVIINENVLFPVRYRGLNYRVSGADIRSMINDSAVTKNIMNANLTLDSNRVQYLNSKSLSFIGGSLMGFQGGKNALTVDQSGYSFIDTTTGFNVKVGNSFITGNHHQEFSDRNGTIQVNSIDSPALNIISTGFTATVSGTDDQGIVTFTNNNGSITDFEGKVLFYQHYTNRCVPIIVPNKPFSFYIDSADTDGFVFFVKDCPIGLQIKVYYNVKGN